MEKDLNVNEYLKDLENEIKQEQDAQKKAEQLKRAEDAWRIYNGDDRVVSSQKIYEEMKKKPKVEPMSTGYCDLDKILGGGFTPNQVVALSAPTKSGKTTFCMELTQKMSEYNPLWLSFEEPIQDLIEKYINRDEKPPMFATPYKMLGNKTKWIEERILEAKVKYDSKIVFIDHLHFIVDMTNSSNVSIEIGATMRQLKTIAKRWGVVIVIVAHMKKTDPTQPTSIDDLRDSSFVAQESDTVLIMWRKAEWDNKRLKISNNVLISVMANRRTGQTGDVEFVFTDGHLYEKAWGVQEGFEAGLQDFDNI